ncbi:MAG: cob(I)yrinic acid a,c-diamide adenosyltransferase [Thermodesulfobacteriota bacterium]
MHDGYHENGKVKLKGMVHVYTGAGKGKTTAALGLAMRALGHGLKVYVIQFMKGNIRYGEVEMARQLSPNLVIKQMGRDTFVDRNNPDSIDIELAQKAFQLAKDVIGGGEYDIVVLDEINVAVDYGLVSLQALLGLLESRPTHVELVLTGRDAKGELIERADLVTEMVEVKHYYRQGTHSRKGIEL